MEYRGYGLSEGSPSEQGLYIDAQSAFNYLIQRSDIDNNKIFLFGRSLGKLFTIPITDICWFHNTSIWHCVTIAHSFLGGAVAIDLASRLENRNKVWAVVIENTFTSIPDMAKIILKWKCLLWLPQMCHKNKV